MHSSHAEYQLISRTLHFNKPPRDDQLRFYYKATSNGASRSFNIILQIHTYPSFDQCPADANIHIYYIFTRLCCNRISLIIFSQTASTTFTNRNTPSLHLFPDAHRTRFQSWSIAMPPAIYLADAFEMCIRRI